MPTIPTKHRADVLQELITTNLEKGMPEADAIVSATLALKADHPEYFPVHRDAQGKPLTLEALVSDHMRDGYDRDHAFRMAIRDGRMTKSYYERERCGAGWIDAVLSRRLV